MKKGRKVTLGICISIVAFFAVIVITVALIGHVPLTSVPTSVPSSVPTPPKELIVTKSPDHKSVLVNARDQCGNIPSELTCVAADANNDQICDSSAFTIPTTVANRLGIQSYNNCV